MNETKYQLELLESTIAAKEIMYSKQKVFDFPDKPRKHLAQLLTNPQDQTWAGQMRYSDGRTTSDLEDKLEIFAQFCEHLYASTSPPQSAINAFLDC